MERRESGIDSCGHLDHHITVELDKATSLFLAGAKFPVKKNLNANDLVHSH